MHAFECISMCLDNRCLIQRALCGHFSFVECVHLKNIMSNNKFLLYKQVKLDFDVFSLCCRNLACYSFIQVLMLYGPDALKKVVENSELYPIRGLFQFSDFFHEVDAYYHQTQGFELGVSTGWRALDELYTVRILP